MEQTYTQSDIDEAVAAVVDNFIEWLWETRSLLTPNVAEARKGVRFLFQSDMEIERKLRALKPNAQQILADMKERVREERDKEWEEKFDSMLGSENKNAFTGPLAARAYAYATVIAEEAEARLRDQIQDYQTDPNYDNRYIQGQDEAMAKMREPSPCGVVGHVRANWAEVIVDRIDGTTEEICLACAQQRELRKIVETLSSFMQDATPELKAKSGPSQQFWWGLVESARRALGEKEATTEEK